MKKKFLGFVVARGKTRIWCYDEVAGKWNKDAEKGTQYEKIRDAQESLKALDKYRKTATIRELHKIDDQCLSVDELTWDNMIKALD
ncbi:hypothetical protein [Pantoea ananatis]|uniref:hypothetical protein n=1 Tax=Pantoea ananas TaxID=553 RepID=UPI0011A00158|nr:hypothetical protein [Pantoea ananatis]